MKKVRYILGILIIAIVVFIFADKFYDPSLPIEDVSANEAIDKLKESNSKITEISVDTDFIWYITSSENKGISIADENIKQMVVSYGWEFKEKDGAGLFFEKEGKRLIVTTQMWNGDYVLVKIPSDFK
jgi:hypothetical protein